MQQIRTPRFIWFDLDGTLANLYSIDGWLAMLETESAEPYIKAGVLLNMQKLAAYLNKLQAAGLKIGVISWLSKNSTSYYEQIVTKAKLNWLNKHLHSVHWDAINIVSYGTPKQSFRIYDTDILFDDELKNRIDWGDFSFKPEEIFDILSKLLKTN